MILSLLSFTPLKVLDTVDGPTIFGFSIDESSSSISSFVSCFFSSLNVEVILQFCYFSSSRAGMTNGGTFIN